MKTIEKGSSIQSRDGRVFGRTSGVVKPCRVPGHAEGCEEVQVIWPSNETKQRFTTSRIHSSRVHHVSSNHYQIP